VVIFPPRSSIPMTTVLLMMPRCLYPFPTFLDLCIFRALPPMNVSWGFFRRRSVFFCEGDQQFCDSDQESERSDAGVRIVSEVIEMVKEKDSILSRG